MIRKKLTTTLALTLLLLSLLYEVRITLPRTSYIVETKSELTSSSLDFNYKTIINASDYPGGNDTERLQAALNDVPPEGAIVIIPPGVWTACGLIAKSRTVIQGYNGTILERPENKTAPFITFENKSEFAVFNITFNSKAVPEAYGIRIIDSEFFAISYNSFLNFEESALKITINYDTCENFLITHNQFKNTNRVPLFLFGSPNERLIKNFVITNNTIINGLINGKIGIAFVSDGIIANNTIINTEHGIATRCISNIRIEGNLIENFTSYGIYLGTQIGDEGTINITIINNNILNGYIGISKWYGSESHITQITISNNNFINNSLYDIMADFPAYFIDNVITSREKLIILCAGALFKGTKTLDGQIIMPGDLDANLSIDIADVAQVAMIYGATPEDDNWNPDADVITNQKVDIQDIAYVASLFGSSEN
jgi:hypothetical protein